MTRDLDIPAIKDHQPQWSPLLKSGMTIPIIVYPVYLLGRNGARS